MTIAEACFAVYPMHDVVIDRDGKFQLDVRRFRQSLCPERIFWIERDVQADELFAQKRLVFQSHDSLHRVDVWGGDVIFVHSEQDVGLQSFHKSAVHCFSWHVHVFAQESVWILHHRSHGLFVESQQRLQHQPRQQARWKVDVVGDLRECFTCKVSLGILVHGVWTFVMAFVERLAHSTCTFLAVDAHHGVVADVRMLSRQLRVRGLVLHRQAQLLSQRFVFAAFHPSRPRAFLSYARDASTSTSLRRRYSRWDGGARPWCRDGVLDARPRGFGVFDDAGGSQHQSTRVYVACVEDDGVDGPRTCHARRRDRRGRTCRRRTGLRHAARRCRSRRASHTSWKDAVCAQPRHGGAPKAHPHEVEARPRIGVRPRRDRGVQRCQAIVRHGRLRLLPTWRRSDRASATLGVVSGDDHARRCRKRRAAHQCTGRIRATT
mmetsp:Transcript_6957/g.42547  ORF Transcript_6957/g.42547 Transcript_6957/m.42547 type:complete len:434 (-) Transcript_6957:1801-3102(-)